MNQFYLNNVIEVPNSVADGAAALGRSMLAYKDLQSIEALNVDSKIVLDQEVDEVTIGDYYLTELIFAIEDSDLRNYTIAHMKDSYPVENKYGMTEDDMPLLDAGYKFNDKDATNIAIVCSHGGLLLTMATSEQVKSNIFTINASSASDATPKTLSLPNLYGEAENTSFVLKVLEDREGVSVNLFDEIREYGNVHHAVERAFRKQTPEIQDSISRGFKEAIQQGLLVPHAGTGNSVITPDNNLVRRETYTKKEAMYEVAVSKPKEMRVFIAQDKGELYILDIKSKEEMGDGGVKQNQALRAAEERFIDMKKGS